MPAPGVKPGTGATGPELGGRVGFGFVVLGVGVEVEGVVVPPLLGVEVDCVPVPEPVPEVEPMPDEDPVPDELPVDEPVDEPLPEDVDAPLEEPVESPDPVPVDEVELPLVAPPEVVPPEVDVNVADAAVVARFCAIWVIAAAACVLIGCVDTGALDDTVIWPVDWLTFTSTVIVTSLPPVTGIPETVPVIVVPPPVPELPVP